MSELLSCPFCGGVANVIDHGNDDGSVSVGCNNDTCLGFSGLGWLYRTEAEAVEAWNTRAATTIGQVAVEVVPTKRTCKLEPLKAFEVTVNMLDQTEWGVCSNCGTASPIDATYCCECGAKVVDE